MIRGGRSDIFYDIHVSRSCCGVSMRHAHAMRAKHTEMPTCRARPSLAALHTGADVEKRKEGRRGGAEMGWGGGAALLCYKFSLVALLLQRETEPWGTARCGTNTRKGIKLTFSGSCANFRETRICASSLFVIFSVGKKATSAIFQTCNNGAKHCGRPATSGSLSDLFLFGFGVLDGERACTFLIARLDRMELRNWGEGILYNPDGRMMRKSNGENTAKG